MIKDYKALVLAAGHGSRMRPITNKIPKPLLPFFNSTIIEFALNRVEPFASRVIINCHHLKEKMHSYFEEHHNGKYTLFDEETLLGTGGTIGDIKKIIGDSDLIIYNSDVFSNVNIQSVIDQHVTSQCIATMVLLPSSQPDKTAIYCNNGQIIGIGNKSGTHNVTSHLFTGIHILSNQFVKEIPDTRPFQVVDQYNHYIRKKEKIGAYIHEGPWFDIGEPKAFFEAVKELSSTYEKELIEILNSMNQNNRMRYESSIENYQSTKNIFNFSNRTLSNLGNSIEDCVFLGDRIEESIRSNAHRKIIYEDVFIQF